VTIHDPVSSLSWLMSRGTGVNGRAHASRAASLARSMPLAAGAHFTKHRSGPALNSQVSPPELFCHTTTDGPASGDSLYRWRHRSPRPRIPAVTGSACQTLIVGRDIPGISGFTRRLGLPIRARGFYDWSSGGD